MTQVSASASLQTERTNQRATRRTHTATGRRPFHAYCVFAAVFASIGILAGKTAVGDAAFALLGLSAPVATVIGVRVNRPRISLSWWLLAAASSLAVVSSVMRNGASEADTALWVHTLAFGSYILLGSALIHMLRARRGPGFPGAVIDGVLVALSITVVIWSLFVVPALDAGQGGVLGWMTALYPIFSGVIVFLIAQLALTRVTHVPAFRLIGSGLVCVLVADVGFAAVAAGFPTVPTVAFDLLYVVSAVIGAGAALHPSMVQLTEPDPLRVHRFTGSRILVLSGALAAPMLILLVHLPVSTVERVPLAVGGLLIVFLVTWRVVDAVTHYARSEDKLAYAATHDSLTKLPNRPHILRILDELLDSGDRRYSSGLALFFCDLDRFKYVNDTWGHSIGDELLGLVALRLIGVANDVGGTVARIGGDEFVLLCNDVPDVAAARALASQLLAAFEAPFALSVGEYHMSPSVGVAHCGAGSAISSGDIIRRADTAMYVAKSNDNHISVFDESMQADASKRLEVESQLYGAWSRGELIVHYQPVVHAMDGRCEAFEALVRWNHPERGLVPPDDFIPVAEESGMIIEIGDFVMETAIATLGRWWAESPEQCPSIAVNASGRQLRSPGFADRVEALLAQHGVPAHRLCVEITETVILDGGTTTPEQLDQLAALGAKIAADDFGTGYSSLSYLKQFPVSRVKIDRGFVNGLDDSAGPNPDDSAIVDVVIAMAKALGLDVVAEGVETEAQRAQLVQRGCQLAQGWLFGKPVPVDEAALLIGKCLPLPA